MLQLSNKNNAPLTNNTTASESDVEILQKTIKRLEHENSELKSELEPSDFIYTSVIDYVENVVGKASPDIFDAYTENTANTLSSYSINVDTCSHPIEIDRWNRFSAVIIHDMWEEIMTACQRGPLLHPNQALYDSSKTDNLKPLKTKQQFSDILYQTIEKPAVRLANALEQKLGSYPNRTCVWYQDHVPEQIESKASKSFAESYPENAKMLDSTSYTQPDACFFGYGKLLMAGVHVDPQSLNVDSYKRFERFYEQHKRDKKSFTDMLRGLEQKTGSDASLNGVSTIFNIILITYSLMIKYNLEHSYATTGRCWLVFHAFRNNHNTFYYAFFESKRSTEALKKCQSADYQYFKQTTFVKVACLLLDATIACRNDGVDDTWLTEKAEPNAFQESGDPSVNAKHLYSTNETNGDSPTSHCPVKKQKTGHDKPPGGDAFTNNRRRPRPEYCTQKCLLGLKSNAPMHPECPNYAIHKKYSDSDLHPIKNTDLVILFYRQLEKQRGGYIRLAGIEGKNGTIFKITVYPHGYTFIGKGVECWDEEYLKDEIYVYDQLEQIQGEWIPVYLDCIKVSDNVRIDRIDDESPRTSLIMFLSYVGEDMNMSDVKVSKDEINKLESTLRELGIRHDDTNLGNIVWNRELNHGMLIDMGDVYIYDK